MNTQTPRTARLGDLIVATFDEAARYGKSPRETSQLAISAIESLLLHAPKIASVPRRTLVGSATR